MVSISLGITFVLIIISILIIIAFGIKNIVIGKVRAGNLIYMAIPFVVYFISLAITGGGIAAGIITMFVMLALMVLAILISGIRGIFNF